MHDNDAIGRGDLGAVSGDLVVLDFDGPGAYGAFAALFPALADKLRTFAEIAAQEIFMEMPAVKVDTVETREDKIMLSQRGVLFQVGGKFPRLTKDKPEGKLTELRKLVESLGQEPGVQ